MSRLDAVRSFMHKALDRLPMWLPTVILVGLSVYLIAVTAITLYSWHSLYRFPGPVDYAESVILYEVNLYAHEEEDPYNHSDFFLGMIYGPVLYNAAAALALFNPDRYSVLRALSAAGLLAIAGSFVVFVHQRVRTLWLLPLAICLSWLAPSIALFGITGKPDSFTLGLALPAFVLAILNKDNRRLYYTAPLFALALFCKASALPAPAAIVVSLLFEDWRRAIRFGLTVAASCAVLLLSFALIYGRGYLDHQFFYNVASFHWKDLQLLSFVSEIGPFIVVAAICFYFVRERELLIYFLLACAFHLPLRAKEGSHINYWHEPTLAVFMMMAVAFPKLWAERKTNAWKRWAVVFLALLLAISVRPLERRIIALPSDRQAFLHAEETLRTLAQERQGDSLPAVFGTNPGSVVRLRREIELPIVDPFLYKQHLVLGMNDGALFFEAIRSQRFSFVLIEAPTGDFQTHRPLQARATPTQLETIERHYEVLTVLPGHRFSDGDIHVLIPRNGLH